MNREIVFIRDYGFLFFTLFIVLMIAGCAAGPQPIKDEEIVYRGTLGEGLRADVYVMPVIFEDTTCEDPRTLRRRQCTEEELIQSSEWYTSWIIGYLKNQGWKAQELENVGYDINGIGIRYVHSHISDFMTGAKVRLQLDAIDLRDDSLLFRVDAFQNNLLYSGLQTLQGAIAEFLAWLEEETD